MKKIVFLSLVILFSSCVSLKKYRGLKNQYANINTILDNKNNEISTLNTNLKNAQSEIEKSNNRISALDEQLKFAMASNVTLTDRITDLSSTTKTNAEIVQRALNEIYQKDLMITELENSLKKKDSVNVILVRKVSNSITNKRFRKSLEKIGLVF